MGTLSSVIKINIEGRLRKLRSLTWDENFLDRKIRRTWKRQQQDLDEKLYYDEQLERLEKQKKSVMRSKEAILEKIDQLEMNYLEAKLDEVFDKA